MDKVANRKKILLVEDDRDLREILKLKLEAAGFIVEEAHDGDVGVSRARTIKPDIILMDVFMPNKGGVDAFMEIKALPDLEDVKCIFLTNYGDQCHGERIDDKVAKELGAVGYIKKSDDLDVIVERVREIMG